MFDQLITVFFRMELDIYGVDDIASPGIFSYLDNMLLNVAAQHPEFV
jgi:hypothetical protein